MVGRGVTALALPARLAHYDASPRQGSLMRARRLAGLVFLTALFWTSAAAQVPRLTLTETLRLDSDAEDFSVVSTAFMGPRGVITVVLMMDHQVRLYDAAGKRIASVGRKGAGPGEFERPLRYGWTADTLWV